MPVTSKCIDDASNKVFYFQVEGILADNAPELQRWEERQELVNEQSLKHMKQTFQERPDNFVAALLVLSTQFYHNFEKYITDTKWDTNTWFFSTATHNFIKFEKKNNALRKLFESGMHHEHYLGIENNCQP